MRRPRRFENVHQSFERGPQRSLANCKLPIFAVEGQECEPKRCRLKAVLSLFRERTDVYHGSRSKALVVGVKQFTFSGDATEKWDVPQDSGDCAKLAPH